MIFKQAVGLPTVGAFGDVHTLTELATAAERHGWDGVHLWDHVLYHQPGWPVVSPFVTAAAIAAATSRVRILLTVALPRRQVQDVAADTAALHALSRGRLTLVTTIGSMDAEYADFGLDPDLRARGRSLDERLDRLTQLWDAWGVARIPIWCGGRWPRKPGLRRAARWDGAMPTFDGQRERNVAVTDFAAAASFVNGQAERPVDIALEGATRPGDGPLLASYAEAGMTWWVEAMGWWRGGVPAAAERIAAAPVG